MKLLQQSKFIVGIKVLILFYLRILQLRNRTSRYIFYYVFFQLLVNRLVKIIIISIYFCVLHLVLRFLLLFAKSPQVHRSRSLEMRCSLDMLQSLYRSCIPRFIHWAWSHVVSSAGSMKDTYEHGSARTCLWSFRKLHRKFHFRNAREYYVRVQSLPRIPSAYAIHKRMKKMSHSFAKFYLILIFHFPLCFTISTALNHIDIRIAKINVICLNYQQSNLLQTKSDN